MPNRTGCVKLWNGFLDPPLHVAVVVSLLDEGKAALVMPPRKNAYLVAVSSKVKVSVKINSVVGLNVFFFLI